MTPVIWTSKLPTSLVAPVKSQVTGFVGWLTGPGVGLAGYQVTGLQPLAGDDGDFVGKQPCSCGREVLAYQLHRPDRVRRLGCPVDVLEPTGVYARRQ